MKLFNRIICAMMSVLIAFSCVFVIPVFAEETNEFLAEKSESEQIQLATTTDDFLEKLLSPKAFSANDFFEKNNQTLDFSSKSRFEIADWAYENNIITEEQRIEAYCELLTTRNFENVICLDSFYQEIENYSSTQGLSSALAAKIEFAIEQRNSLSYSNQLQNTRNNSHIEMNRIIVDDGTGVLQITELHRIMSIVLELKAQYVNMGFDFPYRSNSAVDYIVSMNLGEGTHACSTQAIENTTVGNTCLSSTMVYIDVDDNGYIITSDEILIQRIAHGMFHAIQNIYYKPTTTWFKEACADWGVWATTGLTTGINFNAFINSTLSITANVGNGAMLFPTTIARYYGGAATIVEIYEQLSTVTTTTLSFTTLNTKINAALAARGYTYVDFADVFSQMSGYLAAPSIYSFVATGMQNNFASGDLTYYEGFDFLEDVVRSLGRAYFAFTPDEELDLENYEIEFEVGLSNAASGAITVQQCWYNDSGELIIEHLQLNSDGYVRFVHPHYDEGNPSGFVGIIITNTTVTNSDTGFYIEYTVTVD